MNNPNNYEGAEAGIIGRAGGPPEAVFDGASTQLSIAVSQGYKKDGQWVEHKSNPTVWYTVQAATDYAEQHWPEIDKGDKVRIDDAKQEIRTFLRNDGTPGVEVKLSYGKVKVLERKADRAETISSGKPF